MTQLTRAGHRVPAVADADVVHLYGPDARVTRPRRRWFAAERNIGISPLEMDGVAVVPEAVEDPYWSPPATGRQRATTVACLDRRSLRSVIAQTIARLHRTRDDIEWLTFDAPPAPGELAAIDVWVDPAIDERDFDGFVAEAIVSGVPVVASRTAINVQRLEQGRTGFLVRPNDANELTHAILSALFKPEVAQQKIHAASQTMAKFRARQRLRALLGVYESLLR